MKRIIMLLLFMAAISFQNNSLAQTKVQIGDLYYDLSGANASVARNDDGHKSLYMKSEYIIPSSIYYNGYSYSVTEISDRAFSVPGGYGNGSTAEKIVMPETIIKIGFYAFEGCTKLTSIIIPSSVNTFVDKYHSTFDNCYLLRELIYLPLKAPLNWTATTMTYVPDKQSYSSPSFSINDAHVIEMITFNQTEFEYTGHAPNTIWTNNVEGYTASLSLSALNGEVGNHKEWIPVTFTKGDESFTANVVYRYTVKPAKLTAKVTNTSREYGEENPQFNISYSGFVNGENESVITSVPTVSTTATKTSKVGEYPIAISGGSAKNYEFVYEPGVLTVTKAPLSAKVNDATKVYGSQNPAFTIDYYGLKNNESTPAWTTSPTFQTDATQASGVGTYTVKAVNGVPVNYDLGEITAGILNITPAPLTIKANNAARQYYSDNPTFSYTCNGFVNGENESVLVTAPKLSTTATRTSSVGTYEIKVGETSSPNYSISFVNATLTITPRTLMASVDNYERPYNVENPVFEVKYDGFVGDDDDKVLISKPEAKTTATKTSDVGTYPINVTGGSADNYTFTYTSGILTINKAEQTISWEQDLSALSVDDQVELKAEASSGLPITYTMDQTNIAEIYTAGNKTYLDCKGEGTFQIVAVQNGNKNYYSSTRVRKTITIGNSSGINEMDNSQVKVQRTSYGIKVIDANVGDVICIYTLDGLLQHSVKVESKNVEIPLNRQNVYIIKVGGKIVKLGFNPSE